MAEALRRLWAEQSGMTSVEYALLLALLTLASIAAWTNLGQRKSQMLGIVNRSME